MFNMILSAIVTVIIKDIYDNKKYISVFVKKICEQISKLYKKNSGFIKHTMILYKIKKWLWGWYMAFKFFVFSDIYLTEEGEGDEN